MGEDLVEISMKEQPNAKEPWESKNRKKGLQLCYNEATVTTTSYPGQKQEVLRTKDRDVRYKYFLKGWSV